MAWDNINSRANLLKLPSYNSPSHNPESSTFQVFLYWIRMGVLKIGHLFHGTEIISDTIPLWLSRKWSAFSSLYGMCLDPVRVLSLFLRLNPAGLANKLHTALCLDLTSGYRPGFYTESSSPDHRDVQDLTKVPYFPQPSAVTDSYKWGGGLLHSSDWTKYAPSLLECTETWLPLLSVGVFLPPLLSSLSSSFSLTFGLYSIFWVRAVNCLVSIEYRSS